MAVLGMDTEVVRRLAGDFETVAARLAELEQLLSAELAVTDWVGADRNRFDAEWRSTHATELRASVAALQLAAQVAMQNVLEQEAASG